MHNVEEGETLQSPNSPTFETEIESTPRVPILNSKRSSCFNQTLILSALISVGIIYTALIFFLVNSPKHHTVDLGTLTGILLPDSKIEAPLSVSIPVRDHRERKLCQIFRNHNCKSYFIADSVDLFWVIAPIYSFDVEEDKVYFERHAEFKSYINSFGLKFITIEAIRFPNQSPDEKEKSFESKKFQITKSNNEPYDIQVLYYNVSYIRENLLNVAIRKLDKLAEWEYVAWIDAHENFMNTYWWEETIYKTEKYAAVQLFEKMNARDERNSSFLHFFSVLRMSLYTNFIEKREIVFGNAAAITRVNYNNIGSIYDECIATSCDCAYVLASFPPGVGWDIIAPDYYKNFDAWINHAKTVFKGRRAFIRGHLEHYVHGRNFPYNELQEAVQRLGFNASLDIKRDANFSIYNTNEKVSKELERIIYKAKKGLLN